MRKILSIVILMLSLAAPVKRLDVAKLQPVQTVAVYLQAGEVVLATDTGNLGRGMTAEQARSYIRTKAAKALQDLKESACAVIYLDTAEYLLIGQNAQNAAAELRPFLKDSVKVGSYHGGDIMKETAYWEIHGDLPKLKTWKPVQ